MMDDGIFVMKNEGGGGNLEVMGVAVNTGNKTPFFIAMTADG